jgi:hypothetical protein
MKIRFPLLVIFGALEAAKLFHCAYSRIIESSLVQLGDEFNDIGVERPALFNTYVVAT